MNLRLVGLVIDIDLIDPFSAFKICENISGDLFDLLAPDDVVQSSVSPQSRIQPRGCGRMIRHANVLSTLTSVSISFGELYSAIVGRTEPSYPKRLSTGWAQ